MEQTTTVSTDVYTPINIRQLATKVSPKLGRLVPKFLYSHFEKILHVRELNEFFEAHYNDDAPTFLNSVADYLGFQTVIEGQGLEKVYELEGQGVMFASNHPYGGPEAMTLFGKLINRFPDCKLITQSFLRFIKPIETSCVFNKKDVRSLRQAVEEKRSLLIYPAGFCSRKLSFKDVFDYEWKPSFVKIAKRNNMPIQIFFTDGQMTNRMHRWTKFRKTFHIKPTIETMYLVDEMFKMKDKTLRIVVGDTIYPSMMDNSVSNAEWADRLRQYCYELKSNPMAKFDYNKVATLPKE